MKLLFPIGAAVAALAVTVGAQDSTVKSRTEVKVDDGKVVAMSGCVRHDALTNTYSLVGTIAGGGEEVTTRSQTKTEVEKDEVTVRSETRTKSEDGAVGTSGTVSTYALMPGNVDLKAHIGRQVQIAGVKVDRGERDAEVTVEEKTEVERENARDSSSRTKTEIEVPRGARGSYTVVSVKQIAGTCQ